MYWILSFLFLASSLELIEGDVDDEEEVAVQVIDFGPTDGESDLEEE